MSPASTGTGGCVTPADVVLPSSSTRVGAGHGDHEAVVESVGRAERARLRRPDHLSVGVQQPPPTLLVLALAVADREGQQHRTVARTGDVRRGAGDGDDVVSRRTAVVQDVVVRAAVEDDERVERDGQRTHGQHALDRPRDPHGAMVPAQP
jgi:hypothetical protein